MAEEIFVDASFWVALIYRRDQRHDEAVRHWEIVNASLLQPVTTNWTLYEALTTLNGSMGRHDLALDLLDMVSSANVVVVDASVFDAAALGIFVTHSDKRWSVVDCANFVCIQERQSRLALSYDIRDFGQAQVEFGFVLLGT